MPKRSSPIRVMAFTLPGQPGAPWSDLAVRRASSQFGLSVVTAILLVTPAAARLVHPQRSANRRCRLAWLGSPGGFGGGSSAQPPHPRPEEICAGELDSQPEPMVQ